MGQGPNVFSKVSLGSQHRARGLRAGPGEGMSCSCGAVNLREGQAWRGLALPDQQPWGSVTDQLGKWGRPLDVSWDILLSKGGLFFGMGLTPMLKESRVAPRSTLTCRSGIQTSSLVLGETRTWSPGPREKGFCYSPCLLKRLLVTVVTLDQQGGTLGAHGGALQVTHIGCGTPSDCVFDIVRNLFLTTFSYHSSNLTHEETEACRG